MDIRLLMDGGAPPAAPPGRKVESPPADRIEFKAKLDQAKGESKIGEVAEAEPNAQLQNLDSDSSKLEVNEEISLIDILSLIASLPISTNQPVVSVSANQVPLSNTRNQGEADLSGVQTAGPESIQASAITPQVAQELNVQEIEVISSPQTAKDDTSADVTTESARLVVAQVATQTKTPDQKVQDTTPQALEVSTGESDGVQKAEVGSSSQSSNEFGNGSQHSEDDKQDTNSNPGEKSTPTIELGAKQGTRVSEAVVQEVKDAIGLTPQERAKVVAKIADKIELLNANSMRQEVRVRMEPEALGTVIVSLKRDIEGLTASLSASNEPLREQLSESKRDLAAALTAKGLQQVKVEISSAETSQLSDQSARERTGSQSQHQNPQSNPQQSSSKMEQAVVRERDLDRERTRISARQAVMRKSDSLYLEI